MMRRFLHSLLVAALLATATVAHAAADPAKVLRVAFRAADDGLDMVKTNNNLYSSWVGYAIFENLLTYDYLARPAKLVPWTAEAMPEMSDDGKTYTFHIKKGIYFTPDPAFKGVHRELTADDYVYTIKRVLDPKNRSPQASSFEGKIVGMDVVTAAAKKTNKFDYDAPVAGLRALDRYTLRISLTGLDQNFGFLLAHATTGAVAREVMEFYHDDTGRHPVGTGPYILKTYVPRSKIVLEANPEYRGFVWNFKSTGTAWDDRVVKEMQGKSMPQIGRVEVAIIEEEQSRWLAFTSGQLDFDELPFSAAPKVLSKGKLKPEFTARGMQVYRFIEPALVLTIFSFTNPVTGGYTNDKIALRRAISMAYDVDADIAQVRFGEAIRAQSNVPPGIGGYDPDYQRSFRYDPALANKLLDHYGYQRGADGFRTLPDGKPLVIQFHPAPNARDVTISEIWKRSLDKIGIHSEFIVGSFADNLKAASKCELMTWWFGNSASIPDGADLMESYYGPNRNQGNLSCYDSKVFNDAYSKARLLPDGPERQKYYTIMNRQLEADSAQALMVSRYLSWISQPWVKGFKKHPVMHNDWQYIDLDKH